MHVSSQEYNHVLTTVNNWSPAQRIALIQDVLEALAPGIDAKEPAASAKTLEMALGLLANDRPSPSDEQVDIWLKERRERKYFG
ncbi:hypothetical protein GC175_31175 [bacterium]|nr:hypothetical protein [bacterium]